MAEENVILKVSLQEYKQLMLEINDASKQLSSTSEAHAKVMEALVTVQKHVNETMKDGKVTLSEEDTMLIAAAKRLVEYRTEWENTNKTTNEGRERLREVGAGMREATNDINTLTNALKQGDSEVKTVSASYNDLNRQLKDLENQWKSAATEAERQQLVPQITEIKNQLKDMDASIGNYGRNVGNYANSFKSAFSDIGGSIRAFTSGSLSGAISGLGNLTKLIAGAGPHAAIFAAGFAAMKIEAELFNQGLEKTRENSLAVAEAWDYVNTNFNAAKTTIINGLSEIYLFIGGLADGIIENSKLTFATVYEEILQYTPTGWMANLVGLDKVAEDINKKAEQNRVIVDKQYKLGRLRRENMVDLATIEERIAANNTKATDKETYSAKQRKQAIAEIREDAKKVLDIKNAEVNAELEIVRIKLQQTPKNKELLDLEASLEAQLIRNNAEYDKRLKMTNRINNGIIRELNAEEEAEKAAQEAAARAAAARAKAAEEERKRRKKEADDALESLIKEGHQLEEYFDKTGKASVNNNIEEQIRKLEEYRDTYAKFYGESSKETQSFVNKMNIVIGELRLKQSLELTEKETNQILNGYDRLENDMLVHVKGIKEKMQDIANEATGQKRSVNLEYSLIDSMSTGQTIEDKYRLEQEKADKLFEIERKSIQARLDLQNALAENTQITEQARVDAKEASANLSIELSNLETQYIIDNNNRQKKSAEEVAKEEERKLKQREKNQKAFGRAVSTVVGNLTDIWEEEIKRKVEEGEISQQQGEAEFENVKMVKKAEVLVNTYSGALGAYAKTKETLGPWGEAAAWAEFAAVIATGMKQWYEIDRTTINGSSAKGGNSGIAAGAGLQMVEVNPLLNQDMDLLNLQSLMVSPDSSKNQSTRVWISQQDIADSQKQVEIRQRNTSF